jgi:tRNA threonylcarbamoyladenosine biosynthesis protein TsaB
MDYSEAAKNPITRADAPAVLLAVETTGPALSVALGLRDGQGRRTLQSGEQNHFCDYEIRELCSKQRLNHLTELIPKMGQLLEEAEVRLSDLKAIAVSAGPGSFTGIRIGVSAVRALAQALDIGIIKTPTLETFVYHDRAPAIVCPIFDARRDQMYAGAYRRKADGELQRLVPGGAYFPDAFLAALQSAVTETREISDSDAACGGKAPLPKLRFYGDGLPVFSEELRRWAADSEAEILFAGEENNVQRASSVLKWAIAQGQTLPFWEVEPIYMRKAEAQRKLEERLLAKGEGHG